MRLLPCVYMPRPRLAGDPDADPASDDVDAPEPEPPEDGAAGMTRVTVGVVARLGSKAMLFE